MSRALLVPDLALEGWPSMDRYAAELARRLDVEVPREAAMPGGGRYLSRYVLYPRALRRYRPAIVHIADHAHCLRAFPGVLPTPVVPAPAASGVLLDEGRGEGRAPDVAPPDGHVQTRPLTRTLGASNPGSRQGRRGQRLATAKGLLDLLRSRSLATSIASKRFSRATRSPMRILLVGDYPRDPRLGST